MLFPTLRKVLTRGFRLGTGTRRRPTVPRPSPLRLEALEDRIALSRTILVDDDRVQCPNADFTSIQAAVNAARPGDTIDVCPGTYREQVYIPASKNGLTLLSDKPLKAIIEAPAVPNNTTEAIVDIDGARQVTVRDFTIRGPLNGLIAGVLVENGGSGTIRGNHLTTIREQPLNGLQQGFGILVGVVNDPNDPADDSPGSATIFQNLVEDYQKAGIVVSGVGSSADVRQNVVRGVGPTAVIGQYGIVIDFGAAADVSQDSVSGNIYTGTDVEVSGILTVAPKAGGVELEDNAVFNNQNGIIMDTTDRAEVSGNAVFDNLLAGIYLGASSRNEIDHNVVRRNGQDGIFLDDGSNNNRVVDNVSERNGRHGIFLQDADNNRIERNRSNNNGGDGIRVDKDSKGNKITKNKMQGNAEHDAHDDSFGAGTAGTANFWKGNQCRTQNRPGLCDMKDQDHGDDDDDDD